MHRSIKGHISLLVTLLMLTLHPCTVTAQDKPLEVFDDQLAKIELPDKPTREQCTKYLKDLEALAQRYSLTQYDFEDYSKIRNQLRSTFPAEQFDLLMNIVARGSWIASASASALERMDLEPAEVKQRCIAKLGKNPAMIKTIVANGWCEEVREPIIKAMLSQDPLPTRDWFLAAIELKEPKLYKRLHERTLQSGDPVDLLRALSALPEYDLVYTIRTISKLLEKRELKLVGNASTTGTYRTIRVLAAERGDLEALGALIKEISSERLRFGSRIENYYETDRIEVIRLIDFKGSNDEIKAWFEANRDKLVFDSIRRRFVVGEAF